MAGTGAAEVWIRQGHQTGMQPTPCKQPQPLSLVSPQDGLKKLYGSIQQWVEWAGSPVVHVLRNLGRSFPTNPSNLLELRALATPEAAKAVLDTLQKPGASKKDTGATIQRVVHDQCVDGCWTEENPDSNRRDVCPHSIPDS